MGALMGFPLCFFSSLLIGINPHEMGLYFASLLFVVVFT